MYRCGTYDVCRIVQVWLPEYVQVNEPEGHDDLDDGHDPGEEGEGGQGWRGICVILSHRNVNR